MFRNYLVVAWRNLVRQKIYSAINIAGLAIGMACATLILLWVQDELSYDRCHVKADQIYRVVSSQWAPTPGPLAPALSREFPEVVETVRIQPGWGQKVLIAQGDRRFYEKGFFYADPAIFRVFTLPFLKGDPQTALQEPNSVVITQEIAEKYFGDEDPIGRTLTYMNGTDYKVTGILRNIPRQSHIRFDFLAPLEGNRGPLGDWGEFNIYTYLLLSEHGSPETLEASLPDFFQRELGERREGFVLQPLTRIHLYSHQEYEISLNGDIAYIYVFSTIALAVLLIACINSMNLSTARSTRRTKEVAMRKIIGARRGQLMGQFLGESVLFSLVALGVAVALVELSLPWMNELGGTELALRSAVGWGGTLGLLGFALAVGLVSGSYPALVLSAFQPMAILKGPFTTGTRKRWFSKALVVMQFTAATVLIIATITIQGQLDYFRNQQTGFGKEQTVVLPILKNPQVRKGYEAIKSELERHPAISATTASDHLPLLNESLTQGTFTLDSGAAGTQTWMMHVLRVDHDFVAMFGLEVVEGRDFSRDFATDAQEGILLNEAAAKEIGWQEPIGKQIEWVNKKRTVVGVVKDFNFESLHHRIRPLALLMSPGGNYYISAKIQAGRIPEAMAFLQDKWKEILPAYPFEYFFLDESFDLLYHAESRLGQLAAVFALLAVFVTCLGLGGLASLAVEQRTKEIGIRKVLGASVPSIVVLLSKEFTYLVLAANLIAWPLAWYAMNRWLQSFAYRIELGPGVFVLGGVLALLIAWLTVSYQAIRAARANPVEALRYE